MSDLATTLLAIVKAELLGTAGAEPASASDASAQGFGALVHLWDHRGATRGFAGRLMPGPSLSETVAEAARMAAREDPRFGQIGACDLLRAELRLVQLGEAVDADHPLAPGEGVFVSMKHHRAVMLPEAGEGPDEVLRRACIAAVLAPDAHQDRRCEVLRLRIQKMGETLLSAAPPGLP